MLLHRILPTAGSGTYVLPPVRSWIEKLLTMALGPPPCLLCDDLVEATLPLCLPCRQSLPWLTHRCRICSLPLPISFDHTRLLCGNCLTRKPVIAQSAIPFRYAPPVSDLILRFKSSGDLIAGRALAELLLLEIRSRLKLPAGSPPPTLVPIPLHPTRLRRRQFNQAIELARPVLHSTGWPADYGLLRRTSNTPSFQGLPVRLRRQHARRMFALTHPPPANVLLIDDVVTTMATAESAARTLRQAGCRQVLLAAVARTPL